MQLRSCIVPFTALKPVHLLTGHFRQGHTAWTWWLPRLRAHHGMTAAAGRVVHVLQAAAELPFAFTALQPLHHLLPNSHSSYQCILCCWLASLAC